MLGSGLVYILHFSRWSPCLGLARRSWIAFVGCGFNDNLISRGLAGCFSLFGLSGASGLPLNPADRAGGRGKEPPQARPAGASR